MVHRAILFNFVNLLLFMVFGTWWLLIDIGQSFKFTWCIILILSFAGSLVMIYNSWYRFSTNPTVISLQKDYRAWKIPFPAATVCFTNKLDENLAKKLVEKTSPNTTEAKQRYFIVFLNSLVNAQYKSLDDFLQFKNDKSLVNLNFLKLATQVSVNMTYTATIFDPAYKNIDFLRVSTEMGICYTFGGVLSRSFAFEFDSNIENYSFKPPYCSFHNSLCYAIIEDLPVNLTNMERDTTFRFLETTASKQLRYLRPEQRGCRFFNEPYTDWNVGEYSYNVCLMECRRRIAYKLCQCSPHFYIHHELFPECGVEGLACLAKFTKTLLTLKNNGQPINCQCLPNCEDIKFFVDEDTKREWSYPVPSNIQFRWAIEIYSKTRLKRDVIYGFEDLLVSFGGTAALFLGCSLLTFIEIIYFAISGVVYYCYSKIN